MSLVLILIKLQIHTNVYYFKNVTLKLHLGNHNSYSHCDVFHPVLFRRLFVCSTRVLIAEVHFWRSLGVKVIPSEYTSKQTQDACGRWIP